MSVQGVIARYRSTRCPSIAELIASEIDLYMNDVDFLTLPSDLLFKVFDKLDFITSDKLIALYGNIKKFQDVCLQDMLSHLNISYSEKRRVERAFCYGPDAFSSLNSKYSTAACGCNHAHAARRCASPVPKCMAKECGCACGQSYHVHCPQKLSVEWDGSRLFVPDIFECCRRRDVEGVIKVLDNDPSLINARSTAWNGVTPIHYAIDFGDIGLVNLLLERGADVNMKSESGLTPLHLCASRNQLDIAKVLLEKGAKVNDTNCTGETPLHLAAAQGHKDMVALLLGHGAFIDPANRYGLSPVFIANFCSRISTANYLYDQGSKGGQEWKRWQSIIEN